MKRTKPPFRADHVGSLLRPQALKEAREQKARRDQRRRRSAVEDREIERVIKKQEEVGLQGDHRRRVPPLVVASTISLGRSMAPTSILASARSRSRREHPHRDVQVIGKLGLRRPSDARALQFVQAHTRRDAENHDPGAVFDASPYGRSDADAARSIRHGQMFYRDLGRLTARPCAAFADAGCRYLQLDEVVHRHAVRSQVPRADDRRAATIPEQLAVVYGDLINAAMSDIPADMTIPHASVPRQLQIDLHGRAAATSRCRRSCSTRSRCTAISWNTTTSRAGGFEPLRFAAEGQDRRAWPRDHQDRQAREQGRAQAPHRRGREVCAARPARALRRSAASPRPRKAIR